MAKKAEAAECIIVCGGGGVWVKNGLFIRRHKRDRERERAAEAPTQKEMFAICDCGGSGGKRRIGGGINLRSCSGEGGAEVK